MSVINSIPLIAAGDDGYQISRSVRLRSSASAYFNRTPASAGNRRTFTWSTWVKRGSLSTTQGHMLFSAGGGSVTAWLRFNGTGELSFLEFNGSTFPANLETTAVFRDPSAWYHIVLAYDSGNATAANRVLIYVNGVSQALTGTQASLNLDSYFNSTNGHFIGRDSRAATDQFDGYLTEVNFIDGQALTPSSFGETDSITGVWKPKKYAGTYGTNGFYLNFSDNSSNTATTIGKDNSGNGNNWTANNISVTAGATYDSMIDVPTPYADGGNGRGNYATLNPLQSGSYVTQSNGNLTNTGNTATNSALVLGSIGELTSGKWYWEYTQGTVQSETCGITTTYTPGTSLLNGENIGAYGIGARANGTVYGGTVGSITSWTTNDIIGIAVDCDNGAIYWSKNGTWLNSGVPTSGSSKTGAVGTWTPSAAKVTPAFGAYNGGFVSVTFGQRPFAYTPPTGFKALNTQNLPEPTIKKGNQYFDVSTWTGDQAARTITNSGAFQPDLIWTKSRSDAESHRLHDAVRGGNGSVLYGLNSNLTEAEGTDTLVSGFVSNGFTIASGANTPNITGRTYVGWQWKESASAGFDIVTYTGTGSALTVNHSLGVAPAFIIVKTRGAAGYNWFVYHKDLGATKGLNLDLTGAAGTSSGYWNNTAPTSTQFTVGSFTPASTQVAYLFAEVAGFSKFGSYTGNGSADGPFVFCGFRPAFVMIKRTDTTSDWYSRDATRDTYNPVNKTLFPNTSAAEENWAGAYPLDLTSSGFKLRTSVGGFNASGGTFIYMAFAEHPFKNALAR